MQQHRLNLNSPCASTGRSAVTVEADSSRPCSSSSTGGLPSCSTGRDRQWLWPSVILLDRSAPLLCQIYTQMHPHLLHLNHTRNFCSCSSGHIFYIHPSCYSTGFQAPENICNLLMSTVIFQTLTQFNSMFQCNIYVPWKNRNCLIKKPVFKPKVAVKVTDTSKWRTAK